jgi:hypothetical protein
VVGRRLREGVINKGWILFHHREAQEELTRTIAKIDAAESMDEIEFEIAMGHMYNHLNTAWNTRTASDQQISSQSPDDFYRWREFPADISMGR